MINSRRIDLHVAWEADSAYATAALSGQVIKAPSRLIETLDFLSELSKTPGITIRQRNLSQIAELNKIEVAQELELEQVGTGIGGDLNNTKELKLMRYREAMKSKHSDKWTGENVKEKNSFDKYKIVTIMKLEDLQKMY